MAPSELVWVPATWVCGMLVGNHSHQREVDHVSHRMVQRRARRLCRSARHGGDLAINGATADGRNSRRTDRLRAASHGQGRRFANPHAGGLRSGVVSDHCESDGHGTGRSAVRQAFTAQVGDVLSLDYNFLTNEVVSDLDTVEDYAFVSISGLLALELASVSDTNISSGPYGRQTGYKSFTAEILQAGTFSLGIGVINVIDDQGQSALLIDNFRLSGSPIFPSLGFSNASFETTTLANFQMAGDATAIGSLGAINPTDGGFQAALTSGGPVAVLEPATLSLMGAGLVSLFLMNQRRVRRQLSVQADD